MGGCAAVNCTNHSRKKHRLFSFPADPVRRRIWVVNCRRDAWVPGRGAQLCSAHFEESQFEQNRADNWKKLKQTAIPTLFDVPNPPPSIGPVRIKGIGKPKPGTLLQSRILDQPQNEVSKESDSEDEVYQNEISCSKSDKQNYKDEAGSSLATDDNSNDEIIVNMGHSRRKRKLNNNELSPKKPTNESERTTAEISYDREDIFGQYVASEMRALRNNPVLYLQTKQSILEILTSANFELINPE